MGGIRETELFGNSTRTATLMLIRMLGETHASEIAQILGRSRSRIKDAVGAFEREGLIEGTDMGSVRKLSLNPKFFAYPELCSLLDKLATQDSELHQRLAEVRRRPRRSGKAL